MITQEEKINDLELQVEVHKRLIDELTKWIRECDPFFSLPESV
jgi:hypothetical protein